MNSHEVFIHIHQGCFAGTGTIIRLPQCQWSKPDGYGKISQCITTTKHSKAKTVCIFLGIYCKSHSWIHVIPVFRPLCRFIAPHLSSFDTDIACKTTLNLFTSSITTASGRITCHHYSQFVLRKSWCDFLQIRHESLWKWSYKHLYSEDISCGLSIWYVFSSMLFKRNTKMTIGGHLTYLLEFIFFVLCVIIKTLFISIILLDIWQVWPLLSWWYSWDLTDISTKNKNKTLEL